MKVSAEVHKIIICILYSTVVFYFSGGVDDALVRLSLVAQFIKDANLMCISFSVKHSQTFPESRMSLSNMSRANYNLNT